MTRFNSSGCQGTIARRMASPCRSRSALLSVLALSCLVLQSTLNGASIQLSWNPPPETNVVGYRIWQLLGTAPSPTLVLETVATTEVVPLNTNFTSRFYVTAFNQAGESPPSNVVTNTPTVIPPPVTYSLVFEAESGTLTPPFYSSGTFITQDALTGLVDGGRATWKFNITNSGSYTVSVFLNAPSEGANSMFLNIDTEPTDPMTIWDVPVTTGFQDRIAAWRGTGGFNTPEFSPKTWTLSTGQHTLVVRGREGGLQLDRITVQKMAATNQPPPVQTPPSAPQDLRAIKISSSRLDLGWVSDLATITKLERSIDGAPFGEIETIPQGVQHTSTAFVKRKTYYYRCRSLNSIGSSGWSNVAVFSSR